MEAAAADSIARHRLSSQAAQRHHARAVKTTFKVREQLIDIIACCCAEIAGFHFSSTHLYTLVLPILRSQ